MQALELSVFEFLSNTKKIVAVLNHREFSCDRTFALQFYDSIKNGDFLGAFSLNTTSNENEYILIDGYTRLMLFSLLVCAITNNNIGYEDFISQLKQNIQKNLKIDFLNKDNEFYKAISTNYFEDMTECPKNVSDIYNLYLEKTALSQKKTQNLIKNLTYAKAIFLIFENEVSKYKLYEAFNSKATQLSEFDLIKNYVFEICEQQKIRHVFNNCFLQIERDYQKQNIQKEILPFITDYLTIQNNGKISQKGRIYFDFKKFTAKITKLRTLQLVLEDFYKYSKYYAQIITENILVKEVQAEIQKINFENATDAYPYLMEVFEDWDKNIITTGMLIDILKMVNLFIEQRKSPDASDFVMSFAKLSTQINKMLALKNFTPQICEVEPLTINKISKME